MAGIGFELRKILKRDSLLSLMQAYSYAALISSGPWIMSIVGILVIGMLSYTVITPKKVMVQFQVSITYVISLSLIFKYTLLPAAVFVSVMVSPLVSTWLFLTRISPFADATPFAYEMPTFERVTIE